MTNKDIQINSSKEIMRGVVCMEDLSKIILSLMENVDESSSNIEIYDAVSDIMSIREMAEIISDQKFNVIVPDNYNKLLKDFSYVGNMKNFHKLATKMKIVLKDCSKQLHNAQRSFYLKSFEDKKQTAKLLNVKNKWKVKKIFFLKKINAKKIDNLYKIYFYLLFIFLISSIIVSAKNSHLFLFISFDNKNFWAL